MERKRKGAVRFSLISMNEKINGGEKRKLTPTGKRNLQGRNISSRPAVKKKQEKIRISRSFLILKGVKSPKGGQKKVMLRIFVLSRRTGTRTSDAV